MTVPAKAGVCDVQAGSGVEISVTVECGNQIITVVAVVSSHNTDDDHDQSADGKDERNDAGSKKHALSRRGLFSGRLFSAAVIKRIDLVHRDCSLVGDLKHFSLDNRLSRFTGAPRAPVISQDVTWT
ncbi:hypothetical protein QO002_005626 [Pararhizobium capsulatum DSM 1112]|uniref:Uncharacterized protein n=1 Tax=Pararhizobium capsulatum DSM 1112 TaxID=1121113 RepID=A0ABU0C170_9HYPH|nr:hypothetical protein [Pararhizobium capsulatum]MDQ0323420.1 hypothetical protein [Pararhizobium capsulatum DSM 1112]